MIRPLCLLLSFLEVAYSIATVFLLKTKNNDSLTKKMYLDKFLKK